jgi:hypothetical protein
MVTQEHQQQSQQQPSGPIRPTVRVEITGQTRRTPINPDIRTETTGQTRRTPITPTTLIETTGQIRRTPVGSTARTGRARVTSAPHAAGQTRRTPGRSAPAPFPLGCVSAPGRPV